MPMDSFNRNRLLASGLAIAATFSLSAAAQAVAGDHRTALVNSSSSTTASISATRKLESDYGKLPISFEANQGQADQRIKFMAHGKGYGLYLTGQEAVLTLHAAGRSVAEKSSAAQTQATGQTDVVRMQLRGANPQAVSEGVDLLPGKVNYITGNDASQWKTDIPTYSKVKFAGVYPGVDLVYYGNQSQLEYDFVVAPQADAKAIQLHFDGAKKLAVNAGGDLAVVAKDGQIAFHKPVLYQEVNGQRRSVEGKFTLMAHNSVGFSLGEYDHAHALVIDPVLAYATYLDGSTGANIDGIAVDTAGNAYVAGFTLSTNFPVKAGLQDTNKEAEFVPAAFVTKLNPTGTALVYSTYLAGSTGSNPNRQGEIAYGITVDSIGDAYIAGTTDSTNFPISKTAYQTTIPGENVCSFVMELNSSGSGYKYSTYLCGENASYAFAIAADKSGDAYVTGVTEKSGFPVTTGAFQATAPSTQNSTFVTEINPTGTALVYSTYLGGSLQGGGSSIAVDQTGEAYVLGATSSTDFPVTQGVFQTVNHAPGDGGPALEEEGSFGVAGTVTVTKLNAAGTGLVYSTYVGGSNNSGPSSIAIDTAGDAYIAGVTEATDYPVTPGAYQTVLEGRASAFVTKLNPTGTGLVYSTFLGGASELGIGSMAVDSAGEACVAGLTGALGLPVTPDAIQTQAASLSGYFTKLNASGTDLVYSTALAFSTVSTNHTALALDSTGNVYIAGLLGTNHFPITSGAFQPTDANTHQDFRDNLGQSSSVIKINTNQVLIDTTTTLTANANPVLYGQSSTFTATVAANGSSTIPSGQIQFYNADQTLLTTVPLNAAGTATYTISTPAVGNNTITAYFDGNPAYHESSDSLTEVVNLPPPVIEPPSARYLGSTQVSITDAAPGVTIRYTTDGSTPTFSSPVYNGPFTLSTYSVVRAVAEGLNSSDFALSPSAEAIYEFNPQTPAPMISPAAGSYAVGQLITLTDATPKATIRYTTDGSTPTITSKFYSGPFKLTGSETIRAIAISTGNATSNVTSATFTTSQ